MTKELQLICVPKWNQRLKSEFIQIKSTLYFFHKGSTKVLKLGFHLVVTVVNISSPPNRVSTQIYI